MSTIEVLFIAIGSAIFGVVIAAIWIGILLGRNFWR